MNGEIDRACLKSLFDFLGKHAFGAHLREGDLLQTVTGGLDDLDFDAVALGA
jgi:hypothetical protein